MSTVRRAFWAGVAGLALALGSSAQEKKDAGPPPRRRRRSRPGSGPTSWPSRASPRRTSATGSARCRTWSPTTPWSRRSPSSHGRSRRTPSHPLAAVVKKLDELQEVKEYKARRLGAFLVFLALKDEFRKDETRDARIKEIEQFVVGRHAQAHDDRPGRGDRDAGRDRTTRSSRPRCRRWASARKTTW